MTALLEPVTNQAAGIAERMHPTRPGSVTVFGPPGSGKATIIREAGALLGAGRPVVNVRGSADPLAAAAGLTTIVGQLQDLGYAGRVRDGVEDDWPRLVSLAETALTEADADGLVVGIADEDRLQALAAAGGTPGRHADELLDIVERTASRRLVSRTIPRLIDTDPLRVESPDLADWLLDTPSWPGLTDAAAHIAGLGEHWTRLPALSVRLLVGLAAIGELPADPIGDAARVARLLAESLARSRSGRPRWAAWQLLARVRPPWSIELAEALIEDVPVDIADPLVRSCLLFATEGQLLQMHPVVRRAGLAPHAAGRPLPAELRRAAGVRGRELLLDSMEARQASGQMAAAARIKAQLVDCAGLAGETDLVTEAGEDLPDPFDHIGQRTTHDELAVARRAFHAARALDEGDATALRGLADIADREPDDRDTAVELLRRVINLEPGDIRSQTRLIGALLATGRPEAADRAFDAAIDVGVDLIATDSERIATELLVPVARQAIAYGALALAVRAGRAAVDLEPSPTTTELRRLAEGLVEALEEGEFVAPRRLGTDWWRQPTLLADRADGQPRDRWLAARIETVVDGIAQVHYADVATPDHRPDEVAWLELDVAMLVELSDDVLPEPLDGTILEIGLYGPAPINDGDPEQVMVVRVAPDHDVELPVADLPDDRYLGAE